MKVLVTAASRHGATSEISRAIGLALSQHGIETEVIRPEEVEAVARFDGVVVGSGVYAGRWLDPAKKLVDRELAELVKRPVWLFSSGPVGDTSKPVEETAEVRAIRAQTHAVDHRVFAGKIDRAQLGFAERAIFRVVRAPEGDFRDWREIEAWAAEIASWLHARLLVEAGR
jgi:menaquinone-dependent protoporphyrinogen oxidase